MQECQQPPQPPKARCLFVSGFFKSDFKGIDGTLSAVFLGIDQEDTPICIFR